MSWSYMSLIKKEFGCVNRTFSVLRDIVEMTCDTPKHRIETNRRKDLSNKVFLRHDTKKIEEKNYKRRSKGQAVLRFFLKNHTVD